MNCNTQNAKIASITEKTLIVGIDVGSEAHYARAFDWRNYEYSKKPLEFSNTEAGFLTFKAWVEDIAEKHGKTAVIPGMEPTGHYWFALGKFLQDNGMKPVHVNPHHVKKSKELDDNNPNKNDRKHNGESRISYRGRKRLRYVLYEAAISLVGKNAEFKAIHEYYRTRKENPLKKMQSVVAVACKMLRVFYAILTKGVDYDPVKLVGDIRRPQLQTA